eukprot:9678531-Ditylum_brightwellii.AAC.1
MVVLLQNWPSWVRSLDIKGCQDIRVVINSDWDVREQEWLRLTLTNTLPNVLFVSIRISKCMGRNLGLERGGG